MRFSLQYYEGTIPPELIAAEGTFSFTASATLTVSGGDVLAWESGEGSPFVLEDSLGSPFVLDAEEGAPLILQPVLI